MTTKKQGARPIMLPADAYTEIEAVRWLVARLGVDKLPPEAQAVFQSSSRITLGATVQAAVAVLHTLLSAKAKEVKKP